MVERLDDVDFVDFEDDAVDLGELREFDEFRELVLVNVVEEDVRKLERVLLICNGEGRPEAMLGAIIDIFRGLSTWSSVDGEKNPMDAVAFIE
jgi:small nuclear ribonucleoprotein (snRNP)-like protein